LSGILLEKDSGQAGVTNQSLILMNSLVIAFILLAAYI
jgi:hypothetical protein